MKEKVKKYVAELFVGITETKQLLELKEEICANLLERANDLLQQGKSTDEAFRLSIANMGDISGLIASLRQADEQNSENYSGLNLDKKHVFGYLAASALSLLGLMVSGIIYLKSANLYHSILWFLPFLLVSAPLFIYFGLTQEKQFSYGMNSRRAMLYSGASELFLLAIAIAGYLWYKNEELLTIFASATPLLIVAIIFFIYLGLTEKIKRKMTHHWQRQWVHHYRNPQQRQLREGISGGLWVLAIGSFFLVSFSLGWSYSWIVFVIAIGAEVIIETVFQARKAHQEKSSK